LKPPSTVAVWGVNPTCPITGIPASTIAFARTTDVPPRSIFTASAPPSFTSRTAFPIACSFDIS
jgi:hypothetical protein